MKNEDIIFFKVVMQQYIIELVYVASCKLFGSLLPV